MLMTSAWLLAAHAADPMTPLAQSPAAGLLARPVTLRGTLGTDKIQMQLHLKASPEEGIEGNYLLFGQSSKVLLAGETENDDLSMEESIDGSVISGQWDGKIEANTIRGTWLSADGSVSKPFELHVVPTAGLAAQKPPAKKFARIARH